MILRDCYRLNTSLKKEMTVGEFIKDIVEKDEKRFFKYYSVVLKEVLPCRNMIFHYEDGILKSHHSSYCKMDYREYLEYDIVDKYGMGLINIDNIADWEKDYDKNDSNKPKVDNKQLSDEDIDKVLNKLELEEKKNRIKKERRKKISQVQYESDSGNIQLKELVECVQAMINDVEVNVFEKMNRENEISSLKDENRRLHSKIKWLEYKMNLLNDSSFNK